MDAEGSSNSTTKLKNTCIVIPIYSFTDKPHCLMNTVTALLELLTALLEYLNRSCPTAGDAWRKG